MIEINDFVLHAPVPQEIIEEYRERVAPEMVEVWENYGYGTFGEGFIRVIDPKLYEAEVGDCIGKTQGDGIAIPVMVTGLGDLITWEPSHNALIGIMYRRFDTSGLGKMKTFFNMARREPVDYFSHALKWDIFPKAVAKYGELAYDESFIFVPLPSMGGRRRVEDLRKRETITSIQVAVDLQGVIGH